MFNEDNTTEKMIIDTLTQNGWEYVPPEELTRSESDPFEEAMVRTALIELNPGIAEVTSHADEIIAKLRRLFATTTTDNLVEQSEKFSTKVPT